MFLLKNHDLNHQINISKILSNKISNLYKLEKKEKKTPRGKNV